MWKFGRSITEISIFENTLLWHRMETIESQTKCNGNRSLVYVSMLLFWAPLLIISHFVTHLLCIAFFYIFVERSSLEFSGSSKTSCFCFAS